MPFDLKTRSLLLFLLFSLQACATPVIEHSWIEVRSPHFVVLSAVGREQSEDLARGLEGFRAVVEMLTSIGRFEPRVPTRILIVPSTAPELGLTSKQLGFFRSGLRENWAVVRPSRGGFSATLYHEYVHFLVHNRDKTRYPAWFDEGFAELLSTTRIRGRRVDLGLADNDNLAWLAASQWISFRRVIEGENHSDWSRDHNASFYAQSWALVHYLHWGRDGREFAEDQRGFLGAVQKGANAIDAFEEGFAEPLEGLSKRIVRYLRRLPYKRLILNEDLSTFEVKVRSLSKGEVAQELGTFTLSRDPVVARRYFELALAENPSNARAHAGLGDSYKFEGRFEDARPYFERAVVLDGSDPLNILDYGEFLQDLARRNQDAEERRSLIREARIQYVRANALEPETPETLVMYGSTFLMDGEQPEDGLEALEAAYALLPGDVRVNYQLARAYAALGRGRDAIPLLEQILTWSHSPKKVVVELLERVRADVGGEPAEGPTTPSS